MSTSRRSILLIVALAACSHPPRAGEPAGRDGGSSTATGTGSSTGTGAGTQESIVSPAQNAAFDHEAAYRAFLATVGTADAGDRVIAWDGIAAGRVRCFALRDGDGLRLKACVSPTGVVRPGGATGDDWAGLLAGAPDAAAAAAWIAWLETDDNPGTHAPRIPRPVTVVTPANAADFGYADEHRARIAAPALVKDAGGATLTAWFQMPGARVPVRWIVRAGKGPATVERLSAVQIK